MKNKSDYTARSHKSFFSEFLRSSRKAFSGNRATSPIIYIASLTRFKLEVIDNSPKTYPRTNPKYDLGVD